MSFEKWSSFAWFVPSFLFSFYFFSSFFWLLYNTKHFLYFNFVFFFVAVFYSFPFCLLKKPEVFFLFVRIYFYSIDFCSMLRFNSLDHNRIKSIGYYGSYSHSSQQLHHLTCFQNFVFFCIYVIYSWKKGLFCWLAECLNGVS